LTWTATGQAKYTVFRDASPTGFTDGSILAVTTATAYVDVNGATGSGIRFYQVD